MLSETRRYLAEALSALGRGVESVFLLGFKARLKQKRCEKKITTKTKLTPNTHPSTRPKTWAGAVRDARVLSIVGFSTMESVSVVVSGPVLFGCVNEVIVTGGGLLRPPSLASGLSCTVWLHISS